MMSKLFLQAVRLCLSASIVTGLVLLLRFAFRKAPKSLICALWILVGLRLMIPAMPSSKVSVIPEAVSDGMVMGELQQQPVEAVDTVWEGDAYYEEITAKYQNLPVYQAADGQKYVEVSSREQAPPKTFGDSVVPALSVVWIAGVGIMLLYMIWSYLRLNLRLRTAVIREKGVWESDQISSPFILGIFRPRICLPMSLSEEERQFVLAHERTHIRRGDQFWKPLSYVLLAVYWFNPLFWLAYFLVCRDIESACDESVIRSEGTAYRKAYSETLLKLNVRQKAVSACPLAFAENSVGGRIRSILNYKKPAFWLVAAALIISVVAAGCALTDPTKKETPAPESTKQTASKASTEESTAPESTEAPGTADPETTEPATTEPSAELPTESEPVPTERTACTTVLLEGSVNDETGITYYLASDGVYRTPRDFAVISENDIMILDTQAHRLQRYMDGKYFETISLPNGGYKLCVTGEKAYVLSNDSLLIIDLNTKEISTVPLPDPNFGMFVKDLFEQDGKLYLANSEFGNYCLNEETKKVESVKANISYNAYRVEGKDGNKIRVVKGDWSWDIPAPNCFGDVIGFGDKDRVLYFYLYDQDHKPDDEGYCRILKCELGKGIAAESFVDVSKWIEPVSPEPQGFAKVGKDGSIYVLAPYEEMFAVYKLNVGAEDIVAP